MDADGSTALVGLDVWEHAHYKKFGSKRGDYVAAWWPVDSINSFSIPARDRFNSYYFCFALDKRRAIFPFLFFLSLLHSAFTF